MRDKQTYPNDNSSQENKSLDDLIKNDDDTFLKELIEFNELLENNSDDITDDKYKGISDILLNGYNMNERADDAREGNCSIKNDIPDNPVDFDFTDSISKIKV